MNKKNYFQDSKSTKSVQANISIQNKKKNKKEKEENNFFFIIFSFFLFALAINNKNEKTRSLKIGI